MNIEGFKTIVTSKAARQLFVARKHSPRVLFVAGTVGVVTATVLACRATLKMDEVLEKTEEEQHKLEVSLNRQENEELYVKESRKLKIRAGLEIAKLYAPAVGIGAVSIAALTGSHVVLTKRNGALMAAYAGLDRAYKEYRQRVVEEYGDQVDRKFALGLEDVEVEEKTADGKTKTTTVQKKSDKWLGGSPYARLFDETSPKWSAEPGRNQMTIQMLQSYANDKLRAQGHLFLNEVYDMLGISRTPEGQIVGWIYRRDNEPKNGDNYVSFGVFEGDTESARRFVEWDENSVWLDFNVDGPIHNKI